MSERAAQEPVPVLDIEGHGGRRLAETVQGAGMQPVPCPTLSSWIRVLTSSASVGVIAYEALWPDPQQALRSVRDAAPHARIIVMHSDGPRLRLGMRLWSVGLCDHFLPRATPPHELLPVIRQAQADLIIERAGEQEEDAPSAEAARLQKLVRFVSQVNAALVNRRTVSELLRELHTRLPQLIDHMLLEVLLVGADGPKMFVLPTTTVPHELTWALTNATCAALDPFLEQPLDPQTLAFLDSTPLSSGESTPLYVGGPVDPDRFLTFPMVIGGELVGCMSLLLTRTISADQRAIVRLISYQLGTSLRGAMALQKAESASFIDELTGAFNRRYLARLLETEYRRAARYQQKLSVAMIDIDHFKQLNDVHGHLVGDQVLRTLSAAFRSLLRDTDSFVRYGGEEFLVVLPQTGASDAALVLERMRLHLASHPILTERSGTLKVTFSGGIAAYPACAATTPDELVRYADEALLIAKRSGRDRVCVATSGEFEQIEARGHEKRRFPRIKSQLPVRYIELPDLETRMVEMSATDVSAHGIAVKGSKHHLKKNSFALVYLGSEQRAILSKVRWTREADDGDQRAAGLEFIKNVDLDTGSRPIPVVKREALVITGRPETRSLALRALHAANYGVHVLQPGQPLASELVERCSVVLVGGQSFRGTLGAELRALRAKHPALRLLVLSEEGGRRDALATIHQEEVEHLVSAQPDAPAAEEGLFITLSKLLLGQYFGMDKYLLWGSETRSWSIVDPADKEKVLAGIRAVAESVSCHPRIIDLLISAVDEMIINALFRPAERAAVEVRPVTVECGSDGRLLAVGVTDEHGLFEPDDLYRAVGQALVQDQEGMAPEASQGSLGFRIMLTALSQLAINVDPGRATEIIGIVDLRKSLKEYRQLTPSLGMFRKDESAEIKLDPAKK